MTERRLPLAFGNTGTSSDADQNDLIQKTAGGLWVTRGPGEIILPGRFLLRTVYKTGTALTHTLQTLTTIFLARAQGPGGGGGGVGVASGTTSGVAQGGSGGGYAEGFFTVTPGFSTLTYTVGLGGAGGSGPGNGSDGTAGTSITYHSTGLFGNAGNGGAGTAAADHSSGGPFLAPSSFIQGGISSGGGFGMQGGVPDAGIIFSNILGFSGRGGSSWMGRGGDSVIHSGASSSGVLGGAPGFLGGGGSGGLSLECLFATPGGNGGDGILIIDEYS